LSYEERREKVCHSLKEVGLDPDTLDRYPHEFSGGQRQRIAIARAMVLEPKFVMLDEPTSALDQSVQAQIVELLRQLQRKHGLGYLFISHDLRVVRALCNDVIVLRNGKVVETGSAEEIFTAPKEDYTRALLAAAAELILCSTGRADETRPVHPPSRSCSPGDRNHRPQRRELRQDDAEHAVPERGSRMCHVDVVRQLDSPVQVV